MVIMVVGNKCDLEEGRVISLQDGEAKAQRNKVAFLETSALNATKVVLKNELLDGFILPKGIDVDNIKISYSFEVNALEEQLTKVVDQLLEEKTLESFKSKQGNVKVVAMEYDPKTGKLREVDMDNLDLNDNDE